MGFLYGKPAAERILNSVKEAVLMSGATPGLAVILIGDDKPSQTYVSLKEIKAREAGFYFEKHLFLSDAKTEEIINLIEKLNDKPEIHGILVQLPLPPHMDTDAIIAAIAPVKDADGFHKDTVKKFMGGDEKSMPVFPQAIIEMIKESGLPPKNKKAAIVANSSLFGSVLQRALENYGLDASVIQPAEMAKHTGILKEADVIVTACGKPKLISGDMVKYDSVIMDGGTSQFEGKTAGDIDTKGMESLNVILTPVPGGVGPVTVACLLRNVARLAGMGL